jgi:hypothetical protein
MDEPDVTIGEVIETVISVLDALAGIAIADLSQVENEERGLRTIRARINLIVNIMEAKKGRGLTLVQG